MAADRAFLHDLAKVGLIDGQSASTHHYAHLKNGSQRSLNRLVSAGLLQAQWLRFGDQRYLTYRFANAKVAQAFGAVLPGVGARCSLTHEWVSARLYFHLGRPRDFRLASQFSERDLRLCGELRPDAMYTDAHGETVFVEADSGQYTKAQIRQKMSRWQGQRQVWGQPAKAYAPIPASAPVTVVRIG